jgi:hypothetical protein
VLRYYAGSREVASSTSNEVNGFLSIHLIVLTALGPGVLLRL